MPATMKSLGIDTLPRDERLALVQEIWDTLAAESVPPRINEARRQELARRVAEDDAAPYDAVPWEVVKARTLGRLSGS